MYKNEGLNYQKTTIWVVALYFYLALACSTVSAEQNAVTPFDILTENGYITAPFCSGEEKELCEQKVKNSHSFAKHGQLLIFSSKGGGELEVSFIGKENSFTNTIKLSTDKGRTEFYQFLNEPASKLISIIESVQDEKSVRVMLEVRGQYEAAFEFFETVKAYTSWCKNSITSRCETMMNHFGSGVMSTLKFLLSFGSLDLEDRQFEDDMDF
ncbi:hypothetical protein EOPP23_02965 [Endozoicomonas sp. OPT23]|uniref:hypothetical protein n=1 Tax=Endozoicomonas sp. OPT23 TaxID=2072845 RepID=UPI00129B45CE|nr:hypothetical protein [Endozoicomonas sp. OPT23]MRI31958.1 hypothetical protein [Endozoicomonas sp. OPT23]